jgi:hypothetical protein
MRFSDRKWKKSGTLGFDVAQTILEKANSEGSNIA